MWFEILPPLAIISVCMSLPQILPYYVNQYVFGNPMRRNLEKCWDVEMFHRDAAITGKVWEPAGLESIPDK